MESASCKLTVHDQRAKHRLTGLSKTYDQHFEIFIRSSFSVKADRITRRKCMYHQTTDQFRFLIGDHAAVSVSAPGSLQVCRNSLIRQDHRKAGLGRLYPKLLKGIFK